ncbi:3TM-type holin [uncultured Desulfovibrio sp.]|uniref:3TM-type holin n=1 Tax=uncultured Desulfovibrio sp. TaxID=167968 RepID=UPI002610B4CC|nr:3TM-type holin [uncultured Desulfovibrio sp.]
MWALLGKLLSGIGGAVGRALPDRNKQIEAQGRINEAEVSGAPQSRLRLWRSFLGWVLALLFCWEVVGRLIVIPLFFADWGEQLPPSALDQIMTLLVGMLGLGF